MSLKQKESAVPVIDYEGSRYETDFWKGQGREYEDAAERLALQRLLPPRGGRLAEIGAGFGRLANLYAGYDEIVLFDYSRTLLQSAARRWGGDRRFVFVAGNVYQLPLATGVLDTVVMVRVMHHLADVPAALHQLHRVMHSQSVAVLEFASKRNLKAILRWAFGRQSWSPWSHDPLEFVPLNFDFHPKWMEARLAEAQLTIEKQFAVSHFRLPVLKQVVQAQTLAKADSVLFEWGGRYPLAPSVFVQARPRLAMPGAQVTAVGGSNVASLFRCPRCSHERLVQVSATLVSCPACDARYAQVDGVWDFKELAP